jgi:hypothetical protein
MVVHIAKKKLKNVFESRASSKSLVYYSIDQIKVNKKRQLQEEPASSKQNEKPTIYYNVNKVKRVSICALIYWE